MRISCRPIYFSLNIFNYPDGHRGKRLFDNMTHPLYLITPIMGQCVSCHVFSLSTLAVIVMATDGPVIRNLMLDALDLGYINGEFVFFNIYPFTDDVQFKDFSWQTVSIISQLQMKDI